MISLMRDLLLLFSTGRTLNYLLRDDFTLDAAAPLASPRNAEPGPGQMTLTQTGGQYSKSAGELLSTVSGANYSDVRAIYATPALTRRAGLIARFGVRIPAPVFAQPFFLADSATPGVTSFANIQHGLYFEAGRYWVVSNTNAIDLGTVYSAGASVDLAIVLREAGAEYYLFDGTNWELVAVSESGNAATLYAGSAPYSEIVALRRVHVEAGIGRAFAVTLGEVLNPGSGAGYDADADALHLLKFTLPGVPAAGNEIALEYRVQDANNECRAYVRRNAGNTAWDFFLDTVSAGVATNRITVTNVGTPDGIEVSVKGSIHNCYTLVGATKTKRGAQVNVTHLNTTRPVAAVFTAGTVLLLRSYARTSSVYNLALGVI